MMPLGGHEALPCLVLLVVVLCCILMETSKMFPSGRVTQRFLKPCKPEQGRCSEQKSNKSATLCHIQMQGLSKGACNEGYANHQ